MKIIWDNLEEVKDFINLVGIAKLRKNEKEWGGGIDWRKDGKTLAEESYTEHGPDYVIVTPYFRELSWLFRNTFRYTEKGTRGVPIVPMVV